MVQKSSLQPADLRSWICEWHSYAGGFNRREMSFGYGSVNLLHLETNLHLVIVYLHVQHVEESDDDCRGSEKEWAELSVGEAGKHDRCGHDNSDAQFLYLEAVCR